MQGTDLVISNNYRANDFIYEFAYKNGRKFKEILLTPMLNLNYWFFQK